MVSSKISYLEKQTITQFVLKGMKKMSHWGPILVFITDFKEKLSSFLLFLKLAQYVLLFPQDCLAAFTINDSFDFLYKYCTCSTIVFIHHNKIPKEKELGEFYTEWSGMHLFKCMPMGLGFLYKIYMYYPTSYQFFHSIK